VKEDSSCLYTRDIFRYFSTSTATALRNRVSALRKKRQAPHQRSETGFQRSETGDKQVHKITTTALRKPGLERVAVWLFIDTRKRLVTLHSALDGSRGDGHNTHTV
jgi:hypothetical protein